MPSAGTSRKVRNAGVILLAAFIVWIAGTVWWNSARHSGDQDPVVGEWRNSFLAGHSLTVQPDGTFRRLANETVTSGKWKTIKAWYTGGEIRSAYGNTRPVLKYIPDEWAQTLSQGQKEMLKHPLRLIDPAYLFEEGSLEFVVVPVRTRDGLQLDSDDIEWIYRRPRLWSDWLSDLRFLIIPERAP